MSTLTDDYGNVVDSTNDLETASQPEPPGSDLHNFRVDYIAPTRPDHTFEPRCEILADSSLGVVRVFDVPDPDEGQRAIAEKACRALNSFDALTEAAKAMRSAISFPMTNKEAAAFDLLNAALALAESDLSPKGDTEIDRVKEIIKS